MRFFFSQAFSAWQRNGNGGCWVKLIVSQWIIPEKRAQVSLLQSGFKWDTGWWFGTFFNFPYIGNFIIPTGPDSIIFQRGRAQPPTRLLLTIIIHIITINILTININSILPTNGRWLNHQPDICVSSKFHDGSDLLSPNMQERNWRTTTGFASLMMAAFPLSKLDVLGEWGMGCDCAKNPLYHLYHFYINYIRCIPTHWPTLHRYFGWLPQDNQTWQWKCPHFSQGQITHTLDKREDFPSPQWNNHLHSLIQSWQRKITSFMYMIYIYTYLYIWI